MMKKRSGEETMKSQMTKRPGVNNGMPCLEKVCRMPNFNGSYCASCGWHYKYHGAGAAQSYGSYGNSYSNSDGGYSDSSVADVVDIAAGVGSIIGAAMDIFGGDSGGSSSSADDSSSSNDDDNSGGGGDFGGGGSDSGW